MSWLATALPRLRAGRPATLAVAALVLVTAFVFAAAPRLLSSAANDALRSDVSGAPPDVRNLQLVQVGRTHLVDETGAALEEQLPTSVRSLIVDRYAIVDTPRWLITSREIAETTVRLRFQPTAAAHLVVTSGQLPGMLVRTHPDSTPGAAPVEVFEAALSTETARILHATVGDELVLALDPTDRLTAGRSTRIAILVTATYDVGDATAAYWFQDTALAQPDIRSLSPLTQILDTTVLLSRDAFPALLAATDADSVPLRYTWRYSIAPERLDAGQVDELLADLRRLESVFPTSGPATAAPGGTSLRSGLLRLVSDDHSKWQSTVAVLTVAAVGPAVVGAAALALVTLLASTHRRRALALLEWRGASRGQVLGSAGLEAVLISVPPGFVAALLAAAVVPVPGGAPSVLGALGGSGVAALATVLVVWASVPRGAGPAAEGRESRGGMPPSPRRLVFEGLLVGTAIGGAYLLRERSVAGASSARSLASADPLVAAVPALVGLAAGIIGVRIFPLLMRALARLAARDRGIVAVLAMRRVARGGSGGPILLVVLAAAAVGAFSSATVVHLDVGSDAVAWHSVGAPFHVTPGEAGSIPAGLVAGRLPGVQVATDATRMATSVRPSGATVQLLAVDPPAYTSVTRGTPAAPAFPLEMLSRSGVPSGGSSAAGPFPAIVSSGFDAGSGPLRIGDAFAVTIGATATSFRVAAVRAAFPTLASSEPFIVASRPQLTAAFGEGILPRSEVFILAPDLEATPLRDALDGAAPRTLLEGRAEESARLRGSPTMRAVTVGVALAALLAAAYAALAVAAALALAGASRAVEVAHLRTLGLTSQESVRLVVAEHVPTVAAAFLAGLALGVGLFVLVRPGLGLGAILSSDVEVPLRVDAVHAALLLAAIVAIVALAVALASALERGAAPAAAVRRGFE